MMVWGGGIIAITSNIQKHSLLLKKLFRCARIAHVVKSEFPPHEQEQSNAT